MKNYVIEWSRYGSLKIVGLAKSRAAVQRFIESHHYGDTITKLKKDEGENTESTPPIWRSEVKIRGIFEGYYTATPYEVYE